MSPAEVQATIVSLFGAGGFTAIVVGYLAYKKAAVEGRREPLKPEALATPGPLPGSHDIELLANAVSGLEAAVSQLALLCEFQFVEKVERQDEFRDWSDRREFQAEIAALKALRR